MSERARTTGRARGRRDDAPVRTSRDVPDRGLMPVAVEPAYFTVKKVERVIQPAIPCICSRSL